VSFDLAFVFQILGDHCSLTLPLRYEGSLNHSYEKALKQLLLLKSAPPEAALGSFRIFENAEPPAMIDTSLEEEAPAPPATSVHRLQMPPVVDTLSELSRDFNTLPVAFALP
jgi:hypothetical protein